MAQLINEAKRMQQLAGLITESQLNEDILELKQMSKQLYSFLKKKGFLPELRNSLQTGKPKEIGKGENSVQIVVTDKPDERVIVAITAESVAKIIVGGGDDWNTKATQKFGQNITSNAMSAKGNWFRNPEITKYVDNLGNEILKQIFAKYPNMEYGFRTQDGFWYILEFRFKKTAKGGTVNPNQRPNAPKPAAQPQAESQLNEAIDSEVKDNIVQFYKSEPEELAKLKDFSSKGGVLSKIVGNVHVQLNSSGEITVATNAANGGKTLGKYNNVMDFLKDIGLQPQAESLDIDAVVNEALAKVRKTGK